MRSVVLAVACCLTVPSISHAALYEWRFEGTLTQVTQGPTENVFALGDVWRVSFLIDSNAPNMCEGQAEGGIYRSGPVTTQIGDTTLDGGFAALEINTRSAFCAQSSTFVRLIGVSGPGGRWEGGSDINGIEGYTLPTAFPPDHPVQFVLFSSMYYVRGTGTVAVSAAAVPEPSIIAFLIATGLTGAIRRRLSFAPRRTRD